MDEGGIYAPLASKIERAMQINGIDEKDNRIIQRLIFWRDFARINKTGAKGDNQL